MRGVCPRPKISMMRMHPPQQGQAGRVVVSGPALARFGLGAACAGLFGDQGPEVVEVDGVRGPFARRPKWRMRWKLRPRAGRGAGSGAGTRRG